MARFADPNPPFDDDEGVPLNGGSLTFYQTGTSTLQNTFNGPDLATANANPVILDSDGRSNTEIWTDDSLAYRVVLKASDASVVWDRDPYNGASVSTQFDTVATDLYANSGANNDQMSFVGGYTSVGDGGGGYFYWDAGSSEADNSGTIIKPTAIVGAGRWKRIYSGALDVRWFGAVGDGVTDDISSIQAAHDALPSTGGGIFLPQGKFYTTGEIEWSKNYSSMMGTGGARLLVSGATQNCIRFTSNVNNVEFAHFEVEHTATATNGWAIEVPLSARESIDVKIHDLTFQYMYGGVGVTFTDTASGTKFVNDFYIHDIEMRDMIYRGLQIQCALNWQVSNCTVQLNNTLVAASRACQVDGWTEGIYVTDCQFLNGEACFASQNSISGRSPTHNFYTNISADSAATGFAAIYLTSLRRCHFSGCWASSLTTGSKGYILDTGDVVGAYFHGCHALNCAQNGMHLIDCRDVIIDGFDVISNSQQTNNTYHGILVENSILDFTITKNVCTNSADFGSGGTIGQAYGIYIVGPANDHFIIKDNRVRGNMTGGVFNGAGTSATKIVADNIL